MTHSLFDSTLELVSNLIRCRSVTPEDAGCQELLIERLAALGFRCESLSFGDVTNLWAQRGTTAPLLCLAGHTDVVPSGPAGSWHSEPFSPTLRDGRLYGRGAADMKSSIAAMVVAAEAFVLERPRHKGSLAFLLTSDEEGPSVDGTAKVVELLKSRGQSIDYCVVGEPSSVEELGDTIKNGRRGSLSGRLTVKGIQGHIAYPQQARNPILEFGPALVQLSTTEWDTGNEYFPPTAWQVSNIHAGTGANNVIPGALELDFNFRYSTASTEQSLKDRFESILKAHRLNYHLRWTGSGQPFITAPGSLVSAVTRSIQKHANVAPVLSTNGGTSDGRFIAEICDQIVEFGPTNATIHSIDENIKIDELEKLASIYLDVMRELLG